MKHYVIIHDSPVDQIQSPDYSSFPWHIALFCPRTGKIWAQFFAEAPDGLWIIRQAVDEGQQPRNAAEVPGSLIWHGDNAVPREFTQPLIEREFQLHVAYARRYLWQKANLEEAA